VAQRQSSLNSNLQKKAFYGKNTLTSEGPMQVINPNVNKKWLCFNQGGFTLCFPKPMALTHFSFVTGNDAPARDPVKFKMLGSNDKINWTLLFRTPMSDDSDSIDVSNLEAGEFGHVVMPVYSPPRQQTVDMKFPLLNLGPDSSDEGLTGARHRCLCLKSDNAAYVKFVLERHRDEFVE